MKKIALVTGASSGMGREFVLQIHKRYPNLEEIWAVARNTKALEQLRKKVPKLRICAWNLTQPTGFAEISGASGKGEAPDKNSGEQRWHGNTENRGRDRSGRFVEYRTTELYCIYSSFENLLSLLPDGSQVLCLSSGASFVPQPGFAAYAASKSYVLSFSRAIRKEWKGRAKITIVCPDLWITPFLEKMEERSICQPIKNTFWQNRKQWWKKR